MSNTVAPSRLGRNLRSTLIVALCVFGFLALAGSAYNENADGHIAIYPLLLLQYQSVTRVIFIVLSAVMLLTLREFGRLNRIFLAIGLIVVQMICFVMMWFTMTAELVPYRHHDFGGVRYQAVRVMTTADFGDVYDEYWVIFRCDRIGLICEQFRHYRTLPYHIWNQPDNFIVRFIETENSSELKLQITLGSEELVSDALVEL